MLSNSHLRITDHDLDFKVSAILADLRANVSLLGGAFRSRLLHSKRSR